ncbi:MAG: histidinol-phosphate transaminase [Opitutae bacterium]|nr:histidinol-phosphate transaminase [Opitutae bacterium]
MKLSHLANSRILDQPTYQPGKPIEVVADQYGFRIDEVCKLASNENPWGASPNAIEAGKKALENVHRYPEGSGSTLRKKIANLHGLTSEQFILGNGSNEVIELLGHVFMQPGDEIILGEHAFVVYKLVSLLMGATPVAVEMPGLRHDLEKMRDAITEKTKLIFLPSPNNPTGTCNSEDEIYSFVRSLPEHVIFCLDEAYAEYSQDPPDLKPLIAEGRKVIGLRTFSKIHGLAGLRIGYGYGSPEMIDLLQLSRQPFNLNSIALASASAALDDEDWVSQCRRRNAAGLVQVETGCKKMDLEIIPSRANFLLIKVGQGQKVFESLQERGIISRPMPPSLGQYIRLSIGTEEENDRSLEALNVSLCN